MVLLHWPFHGGTHVDCSASLKDWIPFFESLVWPILIGLFLFFWRSRVSELLKAFTVGVATGTTRITKIGPIEFLPPEPVESIEEPKESVKKAGDPL
jgi:hypothetical protein